MLPALQAALMNKRMLMKKMSQTNVTKVTCDDHVTRGPERPEKSPYSEVAAEDWAGAAGDGAATAGRPRVMR